MKTTYWVKPLIKTAKSYHSFANLAYCKWDIINNLACPLCDTILENSFEVFEFHKFKKNWHKFTFVLLYSANRSEAVIAFSWPKHASPAFYSTIYSRWLKNFKNHKWIEIEPSYLEAY